MPTSASAFQEPLRSPRRLCTWTASSTPRCAATPLWLSSRRFWTATWRATTGRSAPLLEGSHARIVRGDFKCSVRIADQVDLVAFLEAEFEGQRGWKADGKTVSPLGDFHLPSSRIYMDIHLAKVV